MLNHLLHYQFQPQVNNLNLLFPLIGQLIQQLQLHLRLRCQINLNHRFSLLGLAISSTIGSTISYDIGYMSTIGSPSSASQPTTTNNGIWST